MADFSHLKVGDLVYRSLGGLKMLMEVVNVSDVLITCNTANGFKGGWTFDRTSGAEEDADLQWGVKFGVTGSYLTEDPIIS